ncbi:MAG TPA: glycoside hydrolase family 57 protein [Candidatus Saccharimonadales bacterium]|nr:glycoside hydrolase family 57 protein [Candidatus Saccharimonadales bacterium]
MSKAVVLYLHVHQPYRIRHYTVFDTAVRHDYFNTAYDDRVSNERILKRVAQKSYLPTNARLLQLLKDNPEFKLSLSLSGLVIEQLERCAPDALRSFQDLCATGRVEILAETFHHSLAFFYSQEEFEIQVDMHRRKIEEVFGQTPRVFRNTELAYNNQLAHWADQAGYQAVLCEGWDPVLDWRSPNFVYRPAGTESIRLLMKNYRLSDDIAFRFGDREWSEWPLTAAKFAHWMSEEKDATNFNLFMDYETFGEHQWEESGVFDFLENLPKEWLKTAGNTFMTVSQAAETFDPVDEIDVPQIITWADTERDLSAWLGNAMQESSIRGLYDLGDRIIGSGDWELIEDWRRLQTSDHFYYMCTKWFNDGDIHAYFSPYESPYEGYINFMNAYRDLQARLAEKGVKV